MVVFSGLLKNHQSIITTQSNQKLHSKKLPASKSQIKKRVKTKTITYEKISLKTWILKKNLSWLKSFDIKAKKKPQKKASIFKSF